MKKRVNKVVCKICGLNPNDTQTKEQQKWEQEFIEKNNGICSACLEEEN